LPDADCALITPRLRGQKPPLTGSTKLTAPQHLHSGQHGQNCLRFLLHFSLIVSFSLSSFFFLFFFTFLVLRYSVSIMRIQAFLSFFFRSFDALISYFH
jgi:hypothetical protein